jgi:hypothetical protein
MEGGEREDGRKDFCSYIFELRKEMGLHEWHMTACSNAMIIAGSETTARVRVRLLIILIGLRLYTTNSSRKSGHDTSQATRPRVCLRRFRI